MAVCLNHPDREAEIRCAGCGKPICAECVVAAKYCSAKCMQKSNAAAARAGNVLDERRRTAKASLPRKIIFIVILLALAYGAYFYYTRNRKKLDGKARSLMMQVEKSTNDAVKSNQYRAPDSKFKRERENMVR